MNHKILRPTALDEGVVRAERVDDERRARRGGAVQRARPRPGAEVERHARRVVDTQLVALL